MKRRAFLILLTLAALAAGASAERAVAQDDDGGRSSAVARGRLEDVRGRRLVALLVSRALLVDVREPAATAFEDYRRTLSGAPPRPHPAAARRIADKLNRYIRKYHGMAAAESYDEADLVLVFKVTRQRRSPIPGDPFIWGKMYVLAVGAGHAPRLVWESEGDETSPEDATGDFLKALKAARGEK
ncbi:MAG TPA: hypothetical protein VNZ44_01740 [Pyrinomonadaceae bacterium]|nr:hypothetical protein [Pyrinomonadaceae bacterium]